MPEMMIPMVVMGESNVTDAEAQRQLVEFLRCVGNGVTARGIKISDAVKTLYPQLFEVPHA